ncbi:hypothetical protein DFP72DRAFT_988822 [Ephemerocybe angulata]|uniref:Uncharacterized protein n=1 Tax=Ephemerocybe angulata TaxID=980116 RepID=A0A8H6I7B0_9AGAR|nr:hypothetical protein DFP72DRAFT_988822 [Tulosesus angulatus]
MKLAVELIICIRQGVDFLESGSLDKARSFYFEEAKKIVGENVRLPSIGSAGEGDQVSTELYTTMSLSDRAMLLACYNGLGRYYTAANDVESALAWYEEARILYQSTYLKRATTAMYECLPLAEWDWDGSAPDVPELTRQRVISLIASSELFSAIGNTAISVERRHISNELKKVLPSTHFTPDVRRLNDPAKVEAAYLLRHPDPRLCHKLSVTHPRLQVPGSWTKMEPAAGTKSPEPRQRFASFIWNSHLYVFGGWQGSEKTLKYFKDFWCLNLDDEVAGRAWRKLPDYPQGLVGRGMVVHREAKRAYLLTGKPTVTYFDLVAEKWAGIRTTYTATEEDKRCGVRNDWPFRGNAVEDGLVVINKGKIYTFGGTQQGVILGNNLLMELDLRTKKWTRLSGYVTAPQYADYSCPGPRASPCGWVGPDKDRIYVLFGHANRDGAQMLGQMHGSPSMDAYAYHDFWSWGISEGKWRRERLSGNMPSPRTEMGYTFNEKLGKAIVFGGYTPCVPTTYAEKNKSFAFTYYADTFILEPSQSGDSDSPSFKSTGTQTIAAPSETSYPRWRQILTKGFPTYRSHTHLNTDPDTGKVYLFGGLSNADFIPSRNNVISRPFSDVWQLRVDVPGGDFASVDVEEEARTAKVGPWRRCFTCGNTGWWKRCSGRCGGKAFFCGVGCQREGWKEHKAFHDCGKV